MVHAQLRSLKRTSGTARRLADAPRYDLLCRTSPRTARTAHWAPPARAGGHAMKCKEQVSKLLEYQSSTGAFSSMVHLNENRVQDWNGFTTAQVVRALGNVQGEVCLALAQERALHFLQRCESSERPGAFSFWPSQARPSWVPEIPEDADDTAVIA